MAPNNIVICDTCRSKIDLDKDRFVICSGKCGKSFHKRCSRISEVDFTEYMNNPSRNWVCKICIDSQGSNKGTNSPIVAQLSAYRSSSSPSNPQKLINVNEIVDKLNIVIKQNQSLETRMSSLESKLTQTIDEMSNKIKLLHDTNNKLQEQLQNVNFRMNAIDQEKLYNNIEIHGVQQKDGENLKNIILNLADKVGSDIKDVDITSTFRKRGRPSQSTGGTYPIVAVINNRNSKIDFVKKCRKMRNLNTDILNTTGIEKRPIYVNYQLTKMSQFLLSRAKEKKNTSIVKYVWVSEGKILVRKNENTPAILVHNLKQLNDLNN